MSLRRAMLLASSVLIMFLLSVGLMIVHWRVYTEYVKKRNTLRETTCCIESSKAAISSTTGLMRLEITVNICDDTEEQNDESILTYIPNGKQYSIDPKFKDRWLADFRAGERKDCLQSTKDAEEVYFECCGESVVGPILATLVAAASGAILVFRLCSAKSRSAWQDSDVSVREPGRHTSRAQTTLSFPAGQVPISKNEVASVVFDVDKPPDDSCVICLEPLASSDCHEKLASLRCGHAFHLECITRWLVSREGLRCPICSASVREPEGEVEAHSQDGHRERLEEEQSQQRAESV